MAIIVAMLIGLISLISSIVFFGWIITLAFLVCVIILLVVAAIYAPEMEE